MSKLIKQIKAKQTNTRYAELAPVQITDTWEELKSSFDDSYLYEIDVRLGNSIVLPKCQVENATTHVRKQVAEFVYGEFRPLLIEIAEAAYERDYYKVVEKVSKIESLMFSGE